MKLILKNNWLSPSGKFYYMSPDPQEVGDVDEDAIPSSAKQVIAKPPKKETKGDAKGDSDSDPKGDDNKDAPKGKAK